NARFIADLSWVGWSPGFSRLKPGLQRNPFGTHSIGFAGRTTAAQAAGMAGEFPAASLCHHRQLTNAPPRARQISARAAHQPWVWFSTLATSIAANSTIVVLSRHWFAGIWAADVTASSRTGTRSLMPARRIRSTAALIFAWSAPGFRVTRTRLPDSFA